MPSRRFAVPGLRIAALALSLGLGAVPLAVAPAAAAGAAAPAKAAPAETPQQQLAAALATMSKVNSYHAKADLVIAKKKAHIDGDWGQGAVAFDLERADGQRSRNIIIQGAGAWTSGDGGKTWQKHPQPQVLAMQTVLISGSLSPSLKLAERGPLKVIGTEDVEGVKTTHLQIADKSPVDIWVSDDATLGKIVRKVHVTYAADDGDIESGVIYSALNKPVQIKPPM